MLSTKIGYLQSIEYASKDHRECIIGKYVETEDLKIK